MPSTAFTPDRRRLATLRLAAQRIGRGAGSPPAEAVRWMLGMQGQDFPGVKWSVGIRSRQSEASIDAAFQAGDIVRSWPLRGTFHVVAAEDLGWLLALTAPRALQTTAARRAELGIVDADIERARDLVVASLAGRRTLARGALLRAIAESGVSTAGQRGYHILWYLAQTGTLVLGPLVGDEQVYVLLDEWVSTPRRLDGDEALGELAFRYFRSHGPATLVDLARWSGLTRGEVKRGLSVRSRELTALDVDGRTYYLAPESFDESGPAARIHLLPGFDEFLLGYADRSAALAAEHSQAIVPGGGMFKPTIVADGEIVGAWQRSVTTDMVRIEPRFFRPLAAGLRAELDAAAAAYGAYLSRRARVSEPGPSPAPFR